MDMFSERAKKIFDMAGADALLVETDFLRRYLTGFLSTDGYAVVEKDKCTLVVDSRYFEAAEKQLADSGVKIVEGVYAKAEELLNGYHTIGVPYPFLSLANANRLTENGFALKDCMPAFKSAMTVKSAHEIALIQKACVIAEEAFIKLLPEIKEGMTESAVAALLEYNMRSLGAEGVSFDTIVAFGANGSVPHHETGKTKLKFGDPVLIDFGCKVEGYCSDITRTFLFGDDKKHEKFKTVYAEVLKAHELVKENLRAGMTGREADDIARSHLKKSDLAQYFTHSLGHGVGLQIHEYPLLTPRGEEVLKDGMVFSDEPGVYLKGEFGIRIEDTVRLEEGKAVSFMGKTERNLIIL